MEFTLADYNEEVLQLVTLPNLLLNWASSLPALATPFTDDNPSPFIASESGDLDITPELKDAFVKALSSQLLRLIFVSGAWEPGPGFLTLLGIEAKRSLLVLASETIYSLDAVATFTDTLISILERVPTSRALIAAKAVYFGVGGGVDAFKTHCTTKNAGVSDIEESSINTGMTSGVRRCLLEVKIPA